METQDTELLDQLIITGYALKSYPIINGKASIVLKTLEASEQLAVEAAMKDVPGPAAHLIHSYALKALTFSLKEFSYGDKKYTFNTPDDVEAFLKARPGIVVDAIVKKHVELEKLVGKLIMPENLTENFTTTPSTDKE